MTLLFFMAKPLRTKPSSATVGVLLYFHEQTHNKGGDGAYWNTTNAGGK
jgi:hypothetical protein